MPVVPLREEIGSHDLDSVSVFLFERLGDGSHRHNMPEPRLNVWKQNPDLFQTKDLPTVQKMPRDAAIMN